MRRIIVQSILKSGSEGVARTSLVNGLLVAHSQKKQSDDLKSDTLLQERIDSKTGASALNGCNLSTSHVGQRPWPCRRMERTREVDNQVTRRRVVS